MTFLPCHRCQRTFFLIYTCSQMSHYISPGFQCCVATIAVEVLQRHLTSKCKSPCSGKRLYNIVVLQSSTCRQSTQFRRSSRVVWCASTGVGLQSALGGTMIISVPGTAGGPARFNMLELIDDCQMNWQEVCDLRSGVGQTVFDDRKAA